MKTSFYFVLWILIYPLLALIHNDFIDNNAFLVALVIVWGLSWLLNRVMPKILTYEWWLEYAPILEDVYTCNVTSFKRRLTRESIVELVSTIYFVITIIAIGIAILSFGINDWIPLIIFGLFTYGAVRRTINLFHAKSALKSNPTGEQCMDIAGETYELAYATYYEIRQKFTYGELMRIRPPHFKVFQIFSIIMAGIAILLGLLFLVIAILIMTQSPSLKAGVFAGLYFLYGSLAIYFGIKDIISISSSLRKKV